MFGSLRGTFGRTRGKATVSNLYVEIIRNIRVRIGEPKRTFDAREMSYLRITAPDWCKADDDLAPIYRHQDLLLTEGMVVWGALVQANSLLFSPGPHDSPGIVVYAAEPHLHDDLLRLSATAKKLFALKEGCGKTPAETKFGAKLADERSLFLAEAIPKSIGGDSPIVANTAMFPRKHMPGGVLNASYFPLLVHPKTTATLMVPARYWDNNLLDVWL
jgi:hypothetical protein